MRVLVHKVVLLLPCVQKVLPKGGGGNFSGKHLSKKVAASITPLTRLGYENLRSWGTPPKISI